MLALVRWANLRGLREAGRVFAIPTYGFVVMILLLTILGLKDLSFDQGWIPEPPPVEAALQPLGLFLILRAFSSGCSAMTGIEAISTGVKVFREPAEQNARATLLVMGGLLSLMLLSVTGLGYMYGVAPNSDVTVLAQIGMHVFGNGSVLFWLLQLSTLLILVLAANTAFAGFPLLAAMLAEDHCLPPQMRWLGDRLVYQNGIGVLLAVSALMIWICRGDTTVAVNLYALGVFTAFTLSQLGLVLHWWRLHGPGWQGRILLNGFGALSTFVVLIVIIVSKFTEGAWTVVVALPLIVWGLASIRRRYQEVRWSLAPSPHMDPLHLVANDCAPRHQAIVWIAALNKPAFEAVRYACAIADQVTAVMVVVDQDEAGQLSQEWDRLAGSDTGALEFKLLESPFSSLVKPFCDFVCEQELHHPEQCLTVVMPVAVPRDQLDQALLNQRAFNLFRALSAGRSRVFSIVRYYIPSARERRDALRAAWGDAAMEPDHA